MLHTKLYNVFRTDHLEIILLNFLTTTEEKLASTKLLKFLKCIQRAFRKCYTRNYTKICINFEKQLWHQTSNRNQKWQPVWNHASLNTNSLTIHHRPCHKSKFWTDDEKDIWGIPDHKSKDTPLDRVHLMTKVHSRLIVPIKSQDFQFSFFLAKWTLDKNSGTLFLSR